MKSLPIRARGKKEIARRSVIGGIDRIDMLTVVLSATSTNDRRQQHGGQFPQD